MRWFIMVLYLHNREMIMRILLPCLGVLVNLISQNLYAQDGLVDPIMHYRAGEYFQAAQNIRSIKKNPWAEYYIAKMQLYGFGMLRNHALALQQFMNAADNGSLEARMWLAKYYLNANQPELAMGWFKKAADQNNGDARMMCAAAYMFGYGVPKNVDTARHYIIDAAKNGSALAQYTLAENFLNENKNRNYKLAIAWLTKAAKLSLPQAQAKLADVYLAKGDLVQARDFLMQAIQSGYTPAEVMLANIFADTSTPLHSPGEAFAWMLQAAQKNSINAMLSLATYYYNGFGVAQNIALADEWQTKAMLEIESRKKSPAYITASSVVSRWLSVDQSYDFSDTPYKLTGINTNWSNAAALRDNIYNAAPKMQSIKRQELYKPEFALAQPAMISISDYFDFMAPLISDSQVRTWYFPFYQINSQIQVLENSRSIILRHKPWASIFDDGIHIWNFTKPKSDIINPLEYLNELTADWEFKFNYQQLLTFLYQRAILGDADAQFELAQLYQYGIVVAQNTQQAIVYYELATLQEDVRAEYNLGLLYLHNVVGPNDYIKGMNYIMDAAFKGNAYAQYALGYIYEHGLRPPEQNNTYVITPNHQQATAMYYLAAANQYGEAQYRLADVLIRENNAMLSVVAKKNRMNLVRQLYLAASQQGIAEAILPLAFYEAMDLDDAVKPTHAFEVATTQASAGNPLAALLLGFLYERGIGGPRNQSEALYWFHKAASNPVGQFILGTYQWEGVQLAKNLDKGRILLQQSAAAGFTYADYNLAIVKHAAGMPFVTELDKARQQGNSKAGLLLADYFILQANNPDNMQQARAIYYDFATKGNRDAQLKLAFLYEHGLGGEADLSQAAVLYTQAAQQGQVVAQYLLGMMYQLGKIAAVPDYINAKKWYLLARESYPKAAINLGFIFDTVEDNYSRALENYQLAATKGDPMAQYNLGLMFEYGKGREVSWSLAEKFYQQSSNQGFAAAATALANICLHELNGACDKQKAIDLYRTAANAGDMTANYMLGIFSEKGRYVSVNLSNAVKFYQQAANSGDVKAKLALARLYLHGIGAAQDIQHAVSIYQELAAMNNANAQYHLALIYANGMLGEQMPIEGQKMLILAGQNGDLHAKKVLGWLRTQQESFSSFIEPINLQEINNVLPPPVNSLNKG